MASGCSDCSSSARIPPMNIDESPCTRRIGRPSANQRSPPALITWRRDGPSGPATRSKMAAPIRRRKRSEAPRPATLMRSGSALGPVHLSGQVPRRAGARHLHAALNRAALAFGLALKALDLAFIPGGQARHSAGLVLLAYLSQRPHRDDDGNYPRIEPAAPQHVRHRGQRDHAQCRPVATASDPCLPARRAAARRHHGALVCAGIPCWPFISLPCPGRSPADLQTPAVRIYDARLIRNGPSAGAGTVDRVAGLPHADRRRSPAGVVPTGAGTLESLRERRGGG